jgi:hypothetical protein
MKRRISAAACALACVTQVPAARADVELED